MSHFVDQSAETVLNRYRILVDDICRWSDVGCWEFDIKTRQFYIDPCFIEKYDYRTEDLLPLAFEKWVRLIHPDDVEKTTAAFVAIMSGQTETLDVNYRLRKPNGTYRHFLSRGSVRQYNGNGQVLLITGILQDITEQLSIQEKLEQQKQELVQEKETAVTATNVKSEFLARMSHEIRTPMNAVLGMLYLCLQTDLTEKQKDYLEKTQTAANNLLGIINDILDFSKIEANKIELETVPFSLKDVIKEVADIAEVPIINQNLQLEINIDPNIEDILRGDPLRLRQILTNLVSNAVKFTESGKISIRAEENKAASPLEGKISLRFSVSDTGIGLSEEQIDKVFDPFTQAAGTTSRKYGGTGLGLAIVKNLVHLIGGTVGVESEVGTGTTFYFTAVFEKNTELLGDATKILLNQRRILIVDDDPDTCHVIVEMLRSWKMLADSTLSGEDALEMLIFASRIKQPYDVILLDWRMPRMDGIETIRQIHQNPAIITPPHILMISAYDRNECMRHTVRMNVAGVLQKPIQPAILKQVLKQTFVRQQAHKMNEVPTDLHGAKILLVEDNKINQMVAQELLQILGVEVTIAHDGIEAVHLVKKEHYDLILMDVEMPEMDGLTATKAIRRWEQSQKVPGKPNQEPIPILAMTANAMDIDYHRSLEVGMDDHLTKPIDPIKLRLALEKWIMR